MTNYTEHKDHWKISIKRKRQNKIEIKLDLRQTKPKFVNSTFVSDHYKTHTHTHTLIKYLSYFMTVDFKGVELFNPTNAEKKLTSNV